VEMRIDRLIKNRTNVLMLSRL